METWETETLENCLSAIIDYRGKTPAKTSSGVPLITAKIVKNGRIETPTEFIAEKDYDSWMTRGFPKIGDVILTTEAPLGEVAQITDERIALAQRIILLRGRENFLDNSYLKYFLLSQAGQSQLGSRSSGTTVLGIKQSELRKVKVTFPKFSEQQAIAKILSSLDERIELNRQMNETLEAITRALFKAWFVDFEPVRANSENRPAESASPEIAKLFPSEFENNIPKGWERKPLIEFFRLIGGGTPKTTNLDYWNGEILWYSVVDAPNESDVFVIDTEKKITQLGVEKSSTKLLRKGLTIISARGTVGKLAITGAEMTMNQSCYAIEGKFGDYFNYYVVKEAIAELKQKTHGAVFDTITQDTFKSISQILPKEKVIKEFEAKVDSLMKKIEGNLRTSRALSEIRDSLLPRLISGKIPVSKIEGEATGEIE